MTKITPIRHGEVLLLPVVSAVGAAKKVKSYIVGHSETGHHHVLESKTDYEVITDNDDLYVRLFEPATLVHKKTVNRHNDLRVIAGTYKVIRKREYNPFTKAMEQVWD